MVRAAEESRAGVGCWELGGWGVSKEMMLGGNLKIKENQGEGRERGASEVEGKAGAKVLWQG